MAAHSEPAANAADAQADADIYLPAMPQLSNAPSRIERFVTNLFRRRGELKLVVR